MRARGQPAVLAGFAVPADPGRRPGDHPGGAADPGAAGGVSRGDRRDAGGAGVSGQQAGAQMLGYLQPVTQEELEKRQGLKASLSPEWT